MKKVLFLIVLIFGISSVTARDTYSHDISILPVAAQTMVKDNFKSKVNHIKIDKEWGKVSEYDVVLMDGTEISFDHNGNWKDIEVSIKSSVPQRFVPAAITTYVKQNHKKAHIIGIEKKKSGYEVELSNGIEMKFSSDGKFLRYDN